MLVTLREQLEIASKHCSAIPAFNIYNLETALAVIEAAKLENSPVIISFGESYISHAPLETIACMVKSLTKEVKTPVVLHLDHAKDPNTIAHAIDQGFTSVMYDGSALPFKENIENTVKVVELAHKHGVSVEAELGYMNPEDGSDITGFDSSDNYTRPEKALEFVKNTGIDALAVAIGNAHGIYKGIPHLDLNRLAEIEKLTKIPLVLHGCSGIPDEQICKAVALGVRKINVNTELATLSVQAIREYLNENANKSVRLEKLLMHARDNMTHTAQRFIRLVWNPNI